MPRIPRRAARYDGRHFKTLPHRTAHLGYDCYLTGNVDEGTGKVRIMLRPSRVPPTIPMAYRAIMPKEIWWPQQDHAAAHGCIDAVMTQDYKSLEMWKKAWPRHDFGFENFLVFCQRAAANGLKMVEPGAIEQVARFERHGAAQSSHAVAIFPVGRPKHLELVRRIPQEGYVIRIYVVTFQNLTRALRADVLGILGDDRILLGRAYVDLVDGRFEVIENHPGHCKALNLPVDLIYQTLGVRAPVGARRTITPHEPEEQERGGDPRRRAHQVALRAAAVGHAMLVGEPEPLQVEPAPAPPPREPEVDLTVFPDAPGMAGGRPGVPAGAR